MGVAYGATPPVGLQRDGDSGLRPPWINDRLAWDLKKTVFSLVLLMLVQMTHRKDMLGVFPLLCLSA